MSKSHIRCGINTPVVKVVTLAVGMALAGAAGAEQFKFDNGVSGSFDTTISAGVSVRTEKQDPSLSGIAHGGTKVNRTSLDIHARVRDNLDRDRLSQRDTTSRRERPRLSGQTERLELHGQLGQGDIRIVARDLDEAGVTRYRDRCQDQADLCRRARLNAERRDRAE